MVGPYLKNLRTHHHPQVADKPTQLLDVVVLSIYLDLNVEYCDLCNWYISETIGRRDFVRLEIEYMDKKCTLFVCLFCTYDKHQNKSVLVLLM